MNNNEIINGEIVYVRQDEYLVDIFTGTDASLPFSEALKQHEVGDEVSLLVIDVVKGEKIVSEKRVEKIKAKLEMKEKIGSEETVKGTITGFNRGQFFVDLEGKADGICYIKNLEPFFIDNGEAFIGKQYDFHIIGIKNGRNVLYELSREKQIAIEKEEQNNKFNAKFQLDATLKGTVKKHLKSGIIVDCDGDDCFIPKSEVSYVQSKALPTIGEEVEFKIIRVEAERLNAVGSIKELLTDPWTQIEKYNTEDIYTAPIVRVENYGLFVELGEDLTGLIHISELSHDFVDDTSSYKVGNSQEFKVLEIDNKTKKVKLSTKAIYPSKYVLAKDEFIVGQHLVLPVSKFYRSGIFVKMMDNYDVFVKNEELHNHTQVRPTLKIGSKLDFVILEFNDEKEEIIISNQAYVEKETEIFESALGME